MPWETQPVAASVALFYRIAADNRKLLQLDHAPAYRPAFVRKPVHGRGANLFRWHDLARRRVLRLDVLIPIRRQSIGNLRYDFVRREHPANIEMIDADLFVT